VSRFISVGNQAQLTTTDYLAYLVSDAGTRSVGLLLEGVQDGAELLHQLTRLRDAGKPVIALKAGRSSAGSRAVQSHTGTLAGSYPVYQALMRQAGVVLVDSMTELLDALALTSAGVTINGDRLGVLSTSGGACALVADSAETHGFTLPAFPPDLRADLDALLPSFASTANPVDVTGHVATDPGIYGRALDVVLDSDAVDAVVVMLTTIADPQAVQIADQVVEATRTHDAPVLVCWTITQELAPDGLAVLAAAGIPVFTDPAHALRAAAAVRDMPVEGRRRLDQFSGKPTTAGVS
jgi:acyl-CoA synthetase (NDP forming)